MSTIVNPESTSPETPAASPAEHLAKAREHLAEAVPLLSEIEMLVSDPVGVHAAAFVAERARTLLAMAGAQAVEAVRAARALDHTKGDR